MAMREPGTASADFFFVLGDLTSLDARTEGTDMGYAAFGRVTDGLPVLRGMLDLPRSDNAGDGSMKGQMLAEPVKIISIRRAD
jgi:peptidyl-prolyl cis-trans isomerase A (cyclophilin A)